MRVPLPLVLVFVVGAAAAGWWFKDTAETSPREAAPNDASVSEKTPANESKPESQDAASLKAALDASQLQVQSLNEKFNVLNQGKLDAEAEVRSLQARVESLEAELQNTGQAKAKTIAEVVAAIDLLRENGLAAFTSPGATSALVADLRSLGKEGVDAVIGMLDSESEEERFLAAKLLEELGDPAAINDLKKAALDDSSEMVQNMASHALALMDDASVVPALRELSTQDKNIGAKVNSLFGLCKHGDAAGIQATLRFMNSEASKDMKVALGAGVFVLRNESVMPIADATVARFGHSEQVLGMAVNYYKNIHTPASRNRLQDMLAREKLPSSVRDAINNAFQSW